MIKIEQIGGPYGFEAAIKGARLAKESFDRSDSTFYDPWLGEYHDICGNSGPYDSDRIWVNEELGKNDLELMNRLAKAGSEHAKYRRVIVVHVEVTAPIYWWKEMDTYKIGVTRLSDSTMHNIHKHEFTIEDFSVDHFSDVCRKVDDNVWENDVAVTVEAALGLEYVGGLHLTNYGVLDVVLEYLNACRKLYLETKNKSLWWQMIQNLPSTYNQTSVLCMNYEVLSNIYRQRKNHKLDEWHVFCDWIERLPYAKDMITYDER